MSLTETGLDARLAGDLTDAYQFKQLADYDTGTTASATQEDAADVIAAAEHFVTDVKAVLSR